MILIIPLTASQSEVERSKKDLVDTKALLTAATASAAKASSEALKSLSEKDAALSALRESMHTQVKGRAMVAMPLGVEGS